MRYTLIVATVFMVLMFVNHTSAQSTRCPSIKVHDERMTCYALTSGSKSWCGFVKDADKRAWCYLLLERK